MPCDNFTTFILGLPDHCKTISDEVMTFTLEVSPHTCPTCGAQTTHVHDYRRQVLKGNPINGKVTLVYRRRRYRCKHCGKVFPEERPFMARYQRVPASTVLDIINEHKEMLSSTLIASRHGLSPTTVARFFAMKSSEEGKLGERISLDEFRGNAGAKYQVIMTNLDTKKCINIFPDRSKDAFLPELLKYPLEERLKVKVVSIDLSNYFRSVIHAAFPNAVIVADKFHSVRMANDALDTVRKDFQKKLPRIQCKYFKGSRRLMLRRAKDLTKEEDRQALNVMLNFSEQLSSCYGMKEGFFELWELKDEAEFNDKLKQLRLAAENAEAKSFITLLNTTVKWKKEIRAAIESGLSNGFTEGCNNKIKVLKRIGYGYRNFENFKKRIIYVLNSGRQDCGKGKSQQKFSAG